MIHTVSFDWLGVVDYIPILLLGLYYTLLVSVVGLLIGFVLGAIFGLGRISRNKLVYGASTVYVEVFRGVPILILAIWVFYALPILLGFNIAPLIAGIISIGLNSGAYIAEVVRGAVQSVDKGQMEAGRSLGMSHHFTMQFVIWPQAFKRMIPPLGNQFIVSIKDTSVLSVILVPELVFQGRTIVATHFNALEIYTTVAVLYLIVTITLSKVLNITEKRLTHS
ncbi:amino acid ABC transporter permease [Paramicrobacterium chengjingii]|uniref:Amino acid ABC transporter permease n=1 Tax=Paramicrobacterium chengjingii TaxID=2769067 RepID=A0ABX6YM99_9MICO|nr:amino acid ABC transporter permease [Microbacterium chengjingii]QPZ39968.1 amino acid ABC transporter permease [Microbacterium chengjingii]